MDSAGRHGTNGLSAQTDQGGGEAGRLAVGQSSGRGARNQARPAHASDPHQKQPHTGAADPASRVSRKIKVKITAACSSKSLLYVYPGSTFTPALPSRDRKEDGFQPFLISVYHRAKQQIVTKL